MELLDRRVYLPVAQEAKPQDVLTPRVRARVDGLRGHPYELLGLHHRFVGESTRTSYRAKCLGFSGIGKSFGSGAKDVFMCLFDGDRSGTRWLAVLGPAVSYGGYLPPKHLCEEGGYEVDRTGFAPQAADILVRETLRMLSALK